MARKKTRAAGPRPLRRSARNAAATAPATTVPKTPEQSTADSKSFSAPGLNTGDSSVEPSPCLLIPESCRDGLEIEEAKGERSNPGFRSGDGGRGGTEVVDEESGEGGGGCGFEGDVSVAESVGEGQKGEGSGMRRKRIVKKIVKVVKVVRKRVPKKEVSEWRGEGCDGAECKKEDGKSSVDVSVAKNGNDSVAMDVVGDNGGRTVNSIARADLPVRDEGLIHGEFNEGNMKESSENVDSSIQIHENANDDIAVASVSPPIGFEKPVHGEGSEGDMKGGVENEGRHMEDRQRIELGREVTEEGMNKDGVAAGSDRVGCSDNVVSSANSKEEVDGENVGSSAGSKEEADKADGGLLWSGEMEALERKRKRKTEIFVGGLAKDATEDDVREVFEDVGEIVDVKVVKNSETGKSKGYAFVRYAVAADAKKALEKYCKVEVRKYPTDAVLSPDEKFEGSVRMTVTYDEYGIRMLGPICGKECGTRPVEGNDTIFLGNINKLWKEGDVTKLLQDIGVRKIDKVTVMAHPNNADRNRGFAFVELESNKDADVAFKKLQKQDELGKLGGIKVAWAKPLNEPDEEEMLKVKSVYAEFIPLSWDEERVRECFKKFGEIEKVTLARNLSSSRRKDFAFVNFRYREAAITCIQSFKNELAPDGSEVNVKVSLAKPVPKSTSMKKASRPVIKPTAREASNSSQWVKANEHNNKGPPVSTTNYLLRLGESAHSRTAEAVQFLREREQASWMLSRTRLASGSPSLDRPYSLSGNKRPLPIMESDPLYSDFRGHSRARIDNAFQLVGERPGPLLHGSRMTSHPQHQPPSSAHPFAHQYLDPGSSFQRDGGPYYSSAPPLYRYQFH